KTYVKRIIGLPGETIFVKDHTLYINDEVYEQTFLTEDTLIRRGNFGPIRIPNDSYFVMGDHRAISKDSRNGLGFISEEDIIGRSELIIYPFSEWSLTRRTTMDQKLIRSKHRCLDLILSSSLFFIIKSAIDNVKLYNSTAEYTQINYPIHKCTNY